MVKKLIVALSILVVTVGCSVWEIVYSKRLFDSIDAGLEKAEVLIASDLENVDTPECIEAVNAVIGRWNDNKPFACALINHSAIRLLDEKLDMLSGYVEVNAGNDAAVAVRSARTLVADLGDDNLPIWGNLL